MARKGALGTLRTPRGKVYRFRAHEEADDMQGLYRGLARWEQVCGKVDTEVIPSAIPNEIPETRRLAKKHVLCRNVPLRRVNRPEVPAALDNLCSYDALSWCIACKCENRCWSR
jgi:hypothetical protein